MEKGPVYGVELISSLPLGKGAMTQAMPSRSDLTAIVKHHGRVAAGYEVLLSHYTNLKARLDFSDDVKAAALRLKQNNYSDSHDTADGYVSEERTNDFGVITEAFWRLMDEIQPHN